MWVRERERERGKETCVILYILSQFGSFAFKGRLSDMTWMQKVNIVGQFPQQLRALKREAKLLRFILSRYRCVNSVNANPCTCADTVCDCVRTKSCISLVTISAVLLVATSFH